MNYKPYDIDSEKESEIYKHIGWYDEMTANADNVFDRFSLWRYLRKIRKYEKSVAILQSASVIDAECNITQKESNRVSEMEPVEPIPFKKFIANERRRITSQIRRNFRENGTESSEVSVAKGTFLHASVIVKNHRIIEKMHSYSDWREYTIVDVKHRTEIFGLQSKSKQDDFLFYLESQKRERKRKLNYISAIGIPLFILFVEWFFTSMSDLYDNEFEPPAVQVLNRALSVIIIFYFFVMSLFYMNINAYKDEWRNQWVDEYIKVAREYFSSLPQVCGD